MNLKDMYQDVKKRVSVTIDNATGKVVAVGAGAVVVSQSAHATMSADVTAAVATFADVNSAIPVVGGAFLLALGILAAWKLVRGAFA